MSALPVEPKNADICKYLFTLRSGQIFNVKEKQEYICNLCTKLHPLESCSVHIVL